MMISMLAGTVVSIGSLACPPGSESEFVLPQLDQVIRIRMDDPAPGKIDCMGHAAGQEAAAVAVLGNQVSVSEAPYGERFTDGWLNKVWVTTPAGTTVKDFTIALGKAAEREVWVDWERLAAVGIKPEATLAAPLSHVQAEQALRIVNDRLMHGAGGCGVKTGVTGQIAARRTGDLIEISTQEAIDRREMQTVSYDIRPLLGTLEGEKRDAKVKELVGAITGTIDAEGWAENGGDTGRMTFIEGKLFVVAPPRNQKAVAWMFGQISDRPVAGVDVLHAGEPVQTLQVEPVKINANDPIHDALQAELKRLRRDLAWRKAQLGEQLTPGDKAAMDDFRAIKAIAQNNPFRNIVEQQACALSAQVDALQERVDELNGNTGR